MPPIEQRAKQSAKPRLKLHVDGSRDLVQQDAGAKGALPRLLYLHGTSTLVGLAAAMQIGTPTVKSWSQRGSVPCDVLCKVCAIHTQVSLDWLVYGRGSAPQPLALQQ